MWTSTCAADADSQFALLGHAPEIRLCQALKMPSRDALEIRLC